MTELAVVGVALVLFAGLAVLYARRARRRPAVPLPVLLGAATPSELRDQVAAPYVRPTLADPPVVRQLLDQVATEARVLAWPTVDPAFVRQALEEAARTNAATYAAMTATGRHRRPDGELPPGALGMTGIMRKLDADAVAADARMRAAIAVDTGTLPRVRP